MRDLQARPWWNAVRVGVTAALLGAFVIGSAPVTTQAAVDDYGIENGWFFTQTRGQGEAGTGFAVIDTSNINFYSTFQALGGVDALGYPVSHRFTWDGAVVQAFQHGALEWRPESGVTVSNVMNSLSAGGLDSWLQETYAVPAGSTANPGVLGLNDALAAAYNAMPKDIVGQPVALENFGPVTTLRTERSAISQWNVDTNFAPAGTIIQANPGDVLAAAGILPAEAAKAQQASYVYGYGGYYPYAPVAKPQPQYYYPYAPYWGAPQVNSQPYYYPYGYNYYNYYPYGYNYGWGYHGNVPVYPYYPYAPYAPYAHPGYQPYNYYSPAPAYGYGQPYYGPLPQRAVCLGDEQMTFNPNRPKTNERFTIEVTTARPQQQYELRGPGGPQFTGARPGGKGVIYSWTASIGNNGRYNFDFVVTSGTVCTANVVDIG